MRGEFIRGDGLVIPNNVTIDGAQQILAAAFQGAGMTLYAALIQGTPGANVTLADVTEPTIGVAGYERIAIAQSNVGWPTLGTSNNEAYIESDWLTWQADGAPFDEPIQRVALVGEATYTGTDAIYMMSSLLPEEITIDVGTAEEDRRFKYRFYL